MSVHFMFPVKKIILSIFSLWIMGVAFFGLISCATPASSVPTNLATNSNLIKMPYGNRFLSGMNLAWINFGYDLSQFDQPKFTRMLDDIAKAGGNTVRWWIHVNGSDTPVFGSDGLPTAMRDEDLAALKRGLDLAADRGVGLILCLWSFDMLNKGSGIDADRNRRILEEDACLDAYMNRTLAPMVKRMGKHPALIAWEVFNEPEGMVANMGWTPFRTEARFVQRFVNRVAGTVHRAVPGVAVTNGAASFATQSDVCGTNLYRDDRLIAAGGDKDGTLDFYGVHFYPENHGEDISPFHHPAAYWKLDKPIFIGEFPAKGIIDLGKGFKLKTSLSIIEAYEWAWNQGYAGALSWTYSNHDGFGGIDETTPTMAAIKKAHPEAIKLETANYDHSPLIAKPLIPLAFSPKAATRQLNLTEYIQDREDGSKLAISLTGVFGDPVVKTNLNSTNLTITPNGETTGSAILNFEARDSGGNMVAATMTVHVLDLDRGNILLLKPATLPNTGKNASIIYEANDGDGETAWTVPLSGELKLQFDLQGSFRLDKASIGWDSGSPEKARIETSADHGKTWVTAFEFTTATDTGNIALHTPKANMVRLVISERGTIPEMALREFEIEGERTAP